MVASLHRLTTRGKIITVMVLVLIIAVIMIGVWLVRQYEQATAADNAAKQIRQNFAAKSTDDRKTDAITEATKDMTIGKTAEAMSLYDQIIAVEPDPTNKVKLAVDEAGLLYGQKAYDQAIQVGIKAESYSPDKYLVDNLLGNLYMATKQYDQAITYYTAAGNLVDSPTNNTGFTKVYYDQRVQALQALKGRGS